MLKICWFLRERIEVIINLRNQYGMQIPDNQIDQTLEAAKANKRMYAFPEKEMFLKYC